jgi:hypothetical protein
MDDDNAQSATSRRRWHSAHSRHCRRPGGNRGSRHGRQRSVMVAMPSAKSSLLSWCALLGVESQGCLGLEVIEDGAAFKIIVGEHLLHLGANTLFHTR